METLASFITDSCRRIANVVRTISLQSSLQHHAASSIWFPSDRICSKQLRRIDAPRHDRQRGLAIFGFQRAAISIAANSNANCAQAESLCLDSRNIRSATPPKLSTQFQRQSNAITNLLFWPLSTKKGLGANCSKSLCVSKWG